ncbi:MarR family transcriptional regulator [Leuconostoc gasicomitatum]|uniref:MarR family winged helix-turn-helix transcriptional regulator n=1 Tax=Leuconostoc gasicomitatum TaxID=115778 RepID=UPI000BD01162|nr:MarR family winged helix-turn-helix transcriptional regulator [Leuconostoc gasicomitatum]MBZ5944517.1 winged helix-turn-helix transcriptional regulator [Leuconostoc gasicomitatum]MBZ5967858.1 winged helix-turn-helix transcriptional regulator [Leuconostoc gasicomitatum]MBZ5972039.1 winged helix-turn-helix transcriptional regulator [Leuconostoc gasicomitatum]MBZ5972486.1 winged helix-turn-helix transcriptional regulator [Leuconostoc gasicomitatum]QFS14848.1 MarR family transcriptional regulat
MFEIIRNIGSITRKLQIQSNQKFNSLNLGNNRFIYIIRICESPGMFLGEIADQLSIDRTTAFRTIKNLEKLGYLNTIEDSKDKRLRRIYPTNLASEIYSELHFFEQFSSETLLQKLNNQEKEQLLQLLKKIM